MLEDKDKILQDNYILNKRKNIRHKNRILGIKHRLFIVGVLISLFSLLIIYFILPISKVYRINISGNHYLDDSYYQEISKINSDSFYYLTLDNFVKSNILKSEIVNSVEVKHNSFNIIDINVEEKLIIGYVYDDNPYLITEDGNRILMKEEYYDLISQVPLIEGYDNEELLEVARGFKNIDSSLIDEISEIHKYPFSYDDKMMEIIMRSGNYVYVSYYGLIMLNNYHAIEANLKEENNVCIFLDEVTNSGYTSACPFWQSEQDNTTEDDAIENDDIDNQEIQ